MLKLHIPKQVYKTFPVHYLFLFIASLVFSNAIFLLSADTIYAGQTTLSWNAPTTNTDGTPLTDLAGYKIYYGTQSGVYAQNIYVNDKNTTTYTVPNLSDGATYYFAVTAYDTASKESEYSNEVSKTIPSSPPQQYTLTVYRGGTGSGNVTSSPSGISCGTNCAGSYNSGTAVTLTALPDPSSTFAGWSGACSGTGTCSVTTDAAKSVTAAFTMKTFAITASAGTGGSISPSGPVSVGYGANQSFTITANAGYSISAVTVDGAPAGTVSTYAFNNVTAGHTISATFSANTSNLSVTKTGTGTGTITSSPSGINCGSTCSYAYNAGATVTLTASPDASSTFTGWSGACSGTGSCSLTINAAKSVTATFTIRTYTINASAGTGGTISPSGSTSVNYGASQSFSITTNAGYSIAAITVDGAPAGTVSTYAFSNVTANHTISATFSSSANTLTVSKTGTGTGAVTSSPSGISCGSTCSASYNSVTAVTLAAAPDATSTFAGWSGACSGTGTCSVTMDAAKSVSAVFTLKTFTITASAGKGGSISPSGSVSVNSRANRTFSMTPNSGYYVAGVSVDGTSVGTPASYTFNSVSANHSINVTFSSSGAFMEEWGDTSTSNHPNTVEDTYLNIDNNNYSADTLLNTYTWPANSVANAILIKWDLSAIPEGSTIINASLSLFLETYEGTGGDDLYNISVHKLTNKNAVISQATGYNYDASDQWTQTTGVYDNIPLAQGDIAQQEDTESIDKTLGYKSWNVTQMVQDWVNNATANNGMLLDSDPTASSDSSRFFASSEYSNPDQRPKLVITYMPPSSSALSVTKAGTGTGTVASSPGGLSCGSTCSYAFNAGTAVTLTASPDASSTFAGWSGACSGTAACSVTINGAKSVTAAFALKTFTITASAGTGGSISPSGPANVTYGANQTLSMAADPGYSVANVVVDGVSVGAVYSYTFNNITADHTVSASFAVNAPVAYTMTVSKAGTGTGMATSSPAGINCGSTCSYSYNAGTAVTLIAAPDASSTFTGWSGACTGAGSCSVTMNNAKSVVAAFALKAYTITASAGTGGSISPSGAVSVNAGASQTFTVKANAGYSIENVLVDRTSAGTVASYTFTNVAGEHTITATFADSNSSTSSLPKTGQTYSYASGDDGYVEAGIDWPDPRFTDNGDGTLTDNLTGLMWLKDGNCLRTNWSSALQTINTCNSGSARCSCKGYTTNYTDWRLPNIKEIESLINYGESNPAAWLNSAGFQNIFSSNYWSSTTYQGSTSYAWTIGMNNGAETSAYKNYRYYILPVRTTSSKYPVDIPKTGQAASYASGDDGYIQAGDNWPAQRFADNGDGTVTDKLSGLMWLKDAGCFSNNWSSALAGIAGFNDNPGRYNCLGYTAGYSDWRLPNIKEIGSLINFGVSDTTDWLNSAGFTNIRSSYYWSSTSYQNYSSQAWGIYITNGQNTSLSKRRSYGVWPVRGGNTE